MKHIKTTSEAEESMKGLYKKADGTTIKAEQKHVLALRKIVDMVRRKDVLELEISREKGAIMGYMQEHGALVDENGRVLVTWENGGDKLSVDYDGLIEECDIPPSTIKKFTTVKRGSRVFKIEDDNL